MKKEFILGALTGFVLAIVFVLAAYSSNLVALSPTYQQGSSPAEYTPVSSFLDLYFFLSDRLDEILQDQAYLSPPLTLGSSSGQDSLPVESQDNEPRLLACNYKTCETFSIKFDVDGDPRKKSTLWWAGQFNKKETKERLQAFFDYIQQWLQENRCPEGGDELKCEESVTADRKLIIRPKNPGGGSCPGQPVPFTASATGLNIWGSCSLALFDLERNLKHRVTDISKRRCRGDNCVPVITLSSYYIGQCTHGFPINVVRIPGSVSGTMSCVGKPSDKKWEVVFTIRMCISCKVKGPPQQTGEPQPR